MCKVQVAPAHVRDFKGEDMSCKGEGVTHYACDCQLERMANLEKELAEERRKREELEKLLLETKTADLISEYIIPQMFVEAKELKDWKARYEAAREVAISNTRYFQKQVMADGDIRITFGSEDDATALVDQEIEALMKENEAAENREKSGL